MRNLIILFFMPMLLISVGQTMAQSHESESPYRVGVSLGNSFTGYREETYSTINMYLNALTFIVDGNIEKRNLFHSFNIGFFSGNSEMANPQTAVLLREIDHQSGETGYFAALPQFTAIRANIEYALDYRLWGNDTFPGYLGGAFRTDAYLRFANYPSITGLVTFGLHVSQKWFINSENSFILSIGLPFIGYGFRPAWAGADGATLKYIEENPLKLLTELGHFISIHNYWALFGDLKYQHRINNLLSLYSGLGFELSRINIPRPRMDSILRLNAGIAFNF